MTDGLSENDLLDYARTITNKISENTSAMRQIEKNSAEQTMLGNFAVVLDDAVMESGDAHQNKMDQVLSDQKIATGFRRVVFDLLTAQLKQRNGAGVASTRGRGQ